MTLDESSSCSWRRLDGILCQMLRSCVCCMPVVVRVVFKAHIPAVGTRACVCNRHSVLPLLLQVKLPQRVPHGFHAMWVTGQQIKQQQLPGLALQASK
jgi:hypothetical protein